MAQYVECDQYDIPAGVRFDTPRRNQGQIVTISYGDFGRSEAGDGSPYMSRHDASDGSFALFRRADVSPASDEVRRARQAREAEAREAEAREAEAEAREATIRRLVCCGVADVRRKGDAILLTVHGRRTSISVEDCMEAASQGDIDPMAGVHDHLGSVYANILRIATLREQHPHLSGA